LTCIQLFEFCLLIEVWTFGGQLIQYELTSFADDDTSMVALEAAVRGIEKDGLVWGQSKLVAIGFGIKKLQINLVVEDDKVSTDDLQEQIQDFEDYVQSSDVVAMQKL
jgi:elongation factor 1-beta